MFKLSNTRRLFCTVVLIALLLTAGLRQPVRAEPGAVLEITVDTTSDNYDLYACTDNPNDCSLRGAVRFANASPADSEIHITIPAGTYGLTGTNDENLNVSGDLDIIQREVHLEGAGRDLTILDGQSNDRVVDNHDGDVSMTHLTITGGLAPAEQDDDWDGGGGGILNREGSAMTLDDLLVEGNAVLGTSQYVDIGGGVANTNSGTMTILNSSIIDNQACNGGGIASRTAYLTMQDSVVSGNQVSSDPGCGDGGGITTSNGGSLFDLTHVLVENNTARRGGGIFYNGNLNGEIRDSIIRGNTVATGGGGLYNFGTLTLNRVTLSGNQASSGGGIGNSENLFLNNVTVSGNTAQNGGGITVFSSAEVTFNHCTVAGNTASLSGQAYYGLLGNSMDIHNTILTGEDPGNTCAVTGISVRNDRGYNLSSDDSCGSFNFNHGFIDTDPLLGALGDNGGWTPTMALLSGSPAIDTADPLVTLEKDQRDYPRFDGNNDGTIIADIGAFEYGIYLWLPLIMK
jgi:hypothetical protein